MILKRSSIKREHWMSCLRTDASQVDPIIRTAVRLK